MGETIKTERVRVGDDGRRYLVSEIRGTYQAITKDNEGEAHVHTLEKHSVKERPVTDDIDIKKALVREAPHVIIRPSRRTRPSKVVEEETLVFGDMQVPFHDERAMQMAQVAVRELMPTNIVIVGDTIDLPSHSKFEQRPEWAGSTQAAIDYLHSFYAELRANAPDSRIVVVHGNHEQRLDNYVRRNAAEVLGLRRANAEHELAVLSLRYLMRYEDLDIEAIDGYPNGTFWLEDNLKCVHGTNTQKGGSNAAKYLKEEPETTIYGHSHRAELAWKTVATRAGSRSIGAASPGALCSIDGTVPGFNRTVDSEGKVIKKAEDWQQGLLQIHHEGLHHEMVRQKIGRGPRLPELHASSGGLALGTGLIDVANLRQRPPQVPARRYEQHAVLFPAREWWASTPARLLQEHPHLKTPIDPATHAALHEEVSKVPVPDSHTLERVVFLRGTIEDDIVASVRGLMRRLDESSRTAARRDRDLAELAIECLRAQVPFLEYGTPSRK